MEIHIFDTKENKLINRKEILFMLRYPQAPPKRAEIRDAIAHHLKSEPNHIIIRKIRNVFGARKMKGICHVYPNVDLLKKYEPNYILVRHGLAEAKKKEAATKEEKPEAKPEVKPTEVKK